MTDAAIERLCERLEAPAFVIDPRGAAKPVYRTPDGPEAATTIRTLLERVKALEGSLAQMEARLLLWVPRASIDRTQILTGCARADPSFRVFSTAGCEAATAEALSPEMAAGEGS